MTARVQNAGLAKITALIAAASWWIGWGTGSGAAASATALVTPGAESRVAATVSQQTGTVTSDKARFTGTITATGTRAITEVGVFDASTAGNLDVYADFSVVNLVSGDSIAFTIDVLFS